MGTVHMMIIVVGRYHGLVSDEFPLLNVKIQKKAGSKMALPFL
jgi:hypothetical protein